MNATIINLAREKNRLAFLEKNIRDNKVKWNFSIFKAYEIDELHIHKIPNTSISPGLISLALGHRDIVRNHLHSKDHIAILEDDIEFNPITEEAVQATISRLESNKSEWDILFTDICIPLHQDMLSLMQKRRYLISNITLLDLSKLHFAGTTCVIINFKSIQKYYQLLNLDEFLLEPIDLYIKKLIHQNKLNAFCIFPFATSLSRHADASSIQPSEVHLQNIIWNEFRRTMCIHTNHDAIQKQIYSNLLKNLDTQTSNSLHILGAHFINAIKLLK